MPYTFDFVTKSGDIDHFDIVQCDNDRDAAERARRALRISSRAARVTVWEVERPVGSFTRIETALGSDPVQ